MESNERSFTAAESLQLIQSMISNTKKSIGDSSHYYLLWGWSVLVGCLLQFYLLEIADYRHHYYAWFITPVTLVVHFYFLSKDEKKEKVKTFIGDATGYVWMALACSFVVFAFVFAKIGWQYCYPFYILMYGIGTYVTGSMLNFRPLVLGGISCGILAGVAAYFPFNYQILLTALAMVLSYIIPGHILRSRYKKTNSL